MSDILIKAGTIDPVFQLEASSPWSIRFRDADDFLMPFDGTLVLPGVPLEPIDFDHIGTQEWMTLSLRYPQLGPGNSRRFPSLRDMNNRAVVTDKPVIIFIANDYSFFADYHPTSFFSDIRNTYNPVFKNNYVICTTAKYFLFEFDEGVFSGINILPVDLAPFPCSKDFALKTNDSTDSGLTALRNALAAATTMNGKVRAFDLSGRETETYSALLNLGIVKTAIDNFPSDASEKTIKIQFVNIHGEPLRNTVFPLQMIDYEPALAVSSIPGDPPFCEFTFTTDERKIKFRLKTEGSVPDAVPVSYYFHHVALWPGYNFQVKDIKNATEWTSLDLIDSIEPAELRPLTFARICLFNPLSEFQLTVGGTMEDKSYTNLAGEFQKRFKFKDNDQYIFTPYNKVAIYNCAADFFEDYHKLVGSLKANDRVYQVNWQSHPFTHLTGSMSLRSIVYNDTDTASVDAALIKSRESFILLPVKIKGKDMADEEWRVIYLSSALNGNGVFSGDLQTIVSTIPGPGEFSSQVQRTFVRGNSSFAWLLKPRTVSTRPAMATDILRHQLRASWKTRSGAVYSTVLDDLLGASAQPTAAILPEFDPGTISIETNGTDPARLQIRRLKTMSNISAEGDSVCLLVINIVAGCVCLLHLNPPGASAVSDNVIITDGEAYPEDSIEKKAIELLTGTFSGEDELVFAICKAPASPDVAWETLLITGCWYFHFPNDAIRLGDLPVHEEEVAGVFRKAIFNDVKVRAMYWDQYLAQFSGGDAMLRGLSNNQSIANIINKDIGGKHGYAILDRATRDFGSWHQKSSVIIQKDPDDTIVMPDKKDLLISYVGGMDLALGRWDTQEHYQFDPDRQSGLWYDVHVKIEGEAGFDVLRNFAHRWKANGVFLGSGFENVRPVDVPTVVKADLIAPFHIPDPGDIKIPSAAVSNAFVQINRTIPPRSCLSLPGVSGPTGVTIPDESGELGSLASYTHAIAQARKFIIINEQYFFSQEFALKLHERMVADDGPEFLIIVLPLLLNESEYIDPNLFQARKLAIDTLYYGATVGTPGPGGTLCGRIVPPAAGNNKVKDRVAILTPVNTERSAVYVHAKHTIVDDVWMSVGSANMGSRSLTFDGEINAAVVGNSLYKGRMSLVSNHRIEICRQLLGLPNSYSALLQDPYATFRLFKAIELQQESYSLRLHPQPLHTKWLDPLFKVKVGEPAFDNEVDVVATLNFTDPSFSFLICNALDPDGRSNQPIRLAFFAAFGGIGKTVPSASANITFSFSPAAAAAISAAITGGSNYHFIIKLTITTETSTETKIAGPFVVADYPLRISTITGAIVLDQPGETSDVNTIAFPLSVTDKYKATIEVQDHTTTTPGPVQFSAEELFDPSTASPIITHGSVRDITVVLV